MTPVERADKVDEIYTSIFEEGNTIGYTLHMRAGAIDPNPTCGTVACHGGFLAHYFQTTTRPLYDDIPMRYYKDGVDQLVTALGFKNYSAFYSYIKPYWHNYYSEWMFYGTDMAFNGDHTTTFQDIKNFMIDAFARAATEEGNDE